MFELLRHQGGRARGDETFGGRSTVAPREERPQNMKTLGSSSTKQVGSMVLLTRGHCGRNLLIFK
eukprot:117175-Amphidinium_carterae.1